MEDSDSLPVFKPGDVVRLKSGGVMMTVAGEYQDTVRVAWFDSDGFHDTCLHRDCLVWAFN